MQRCFSTVELEELLAGSLDPAEHLDECADCREEFERRCQVNDSADWQFAALAGAEWSPEAEAFLAELKLPDSHRLPDRPNSDSLPESDWFNWDSLNSKKADAFAKIRRQKFTLPPPEVPGFEILGQLGRGGMGVVYKARQTSHDRIVALKMILAGQQATAEDLGRFYDEAEAIARLRHPHIVQIHEVGQLEGRLYFVLEFVEGGTLADRIRQQPLHPRAAAQLLEALARAMNYAHGRGIIHRDLKPANVLLHGRRAFANVPEEADRLPTDWDFRRFMPKITDFGLAKMLDRGTGHTSSGDVLGTPSYMAPEQAQGKPYPISATTDVYSLGAILYELLTGKPPFQGPSPMDTLFMVHTREPEPPRRLKKDIPPKLEAICLKCLKKSASDRYPTAEDLADDLRLFLEGQPVQARGRNPLFQAWINVREKTGTLVFAVLTVILATVAAAGMTYQWRENRDRETQFRALRADLAKAEEELLRFRFSRAIASCEQGYHGRGLLDLAELLKTAENREDGREWANIIEQNLNAWIEAAPHLNSVIDVEAKLENANGPRWFTAGQVFAPSHDGKVTYCAGTDGQVRMWKDGKLAGSFAAHRGPITLLAASPKSPLLLTGSVSEAKLWRTDTGTLAAVLPHPAEPRSLGFENDALAFYTTDSTGTRRQWMLPPNLLREWRSNNTEPPVPARLEFAVASDVMRYVQRATGMTRTSDGAYQMLDAAAWRVLDPR